jgi:hypothetical protein
MLKAIEHLKQGLADAKKELEVIIKDAEVDVEKLVPIIKQRIASFEKAINVLIALNPVLSTLDPTLAPILLVAESVAVAAGNVATTVVNEVAKDAPAPAK